jgi:hypothetical protein
MNSSEEHVECFIQFHMRLHYKSREQIMEIFSHVLRSPERIIEGRKGEHMGVSGHRREKNS